MCWFLRDKTQLSKWAETPLNTKNRIKSTFMVKVLCSFGIGKFKSTKNQNPDFSKFFPRINFRFLLSLAGMMISSAFWGALADKFGRKLTLIWTSVFLCYFGFLTSFSPSFEWVLFLRFLVGFFIGGIPQVRNSKNLGNKV